MISKKDVKELIDLIKSRTGKTQEEVSVGAGYEAKSLTQLLSGKSNLEPVHQRLTIAYKDVLKNSTNSNDGKPSVLPKDISPHEIGMADHEYLAAYIQEKENRRRDAEKNNATLTRIIDTNLTAIQQLLAAIYRHDTAYHQTMLKSLARLEKRKNLKELILEADTAEASVTFPQRKKGK